MLAACGDDPVVESRGGQAVTTAATAAPAATSTTLAGRSNSAELTTTDGYRYRITLTLGPRSATGAADECPGTAAVGRAHLPVTLTVANQATDRPAPFPPLRIEMTGAPGTRPAQVQVRETGGPCTFAPRVSSIGAGSSVVFKGTTPPFDETASPGSAGMIEVKVSETTFSLVAPVP